MKDYITLWAEGMLKRSSLVLKAPLQITGERDQHLGPRYEFAKVVVSVTPSTAFEVADSAQEDTDLRRLGYPDWFIFGLLDVLMLGGPMPLHKVKIVLEKAEYHRVDSSPVAFLNAGRDAGRKIVASLKEVMAS